MDTFTLLASVAIHTAIMVCVIAVYVELNRKPSK
jgi:hypothetical protein